MIDFQFYTAGRSIRGFRCLGHSGYSDDGNDIVCAAVTSAVRFSECAINDVLALNIPVTVEDKDAVVELILPRNLAENPGAAIILETLRRYISQLSAEYPKNINVDIISEE